MSENTNLRIVSLLPSATEIVACLGMTEALVGRSHECDYPPSVADLPVCTEARLDTEKRSGQIDADVQNLLQNTLSIYRIKTEMLEQLKPTHIITQDQCDVCAVNLADVERAIATLTNTTPQIISLQPNLLAEVWQDIERVATALQVDARPIVSQYKNRLDAIATKVKDKANKIPTVVALEWIEPLMTAGNWIPQTIEIAGGKPLLGEKGKQSPYLFWETLLDVNPEIIIIMPCGFNLERTEREAQLLMQRPEWKSLTAVKNGKVFLVDGNAYFNRPGPRLVDSTEILAEIMHPDLFAFGHREQSWKPM